MRVSIDGGEVGAPQYNAVAGVEVTLEDTITIPAPQSRKWRIRTGPSQLEELPELSNTTLASTSFTPTDGVTGGGYSGELEVKEMDGTRTIHPWVVIVKNADGVALSPAGVPSEAYGTMAGAARDHGGSGSAIAGTDFLTHAFIHRAYDLAKEAAGTVEATWTDVKKFGAIGNNAANDSASIGTALSTVHDVLYSEGTYRVGTSGTVGAIGKTHHFARGAKIRVPAGVTFTLRGQVDAPPDQQIFQVDSGGILLTPDLPFTVHAEWWGCKPEDEDVDNAIPIMAAARSAKARRFLFGLGSFVLASTCDLTQEPLDIQVFTPAPQLIGAGVDSTRFDCRAPGRAIEVDLGVEEEARFVRGFKLDGIHLDASDNPDPSASTGLYLRHAYDWEIGHVQISGFQRGFHIEIEEGDTDGSNKGHFDFVLIDNCTLWGGDVDCADPNNEGSGFTFDTMLITSCGTPGGDTDPTGEPTSGGLRVKGQSLKGQLLWFTTCHNVGLFVYGGEGGLGNSLKFELLVHENCYLRGGPFTSGVNQMKVTEAQQYNSDTFPAEVGTFVQSTTIYQGVTHFKTDQVFARISYTDRVISAVDTSTETITTTTSHGFTAGTPVVFTVDPETADTVPGGLTAASYASGEEVAHVTDCPDGQYYVIAAGLTATQFRVSKTRGGAAVNITGAGSGTAYVTRAYRAFDLDGGNATYLDVRDVSWLTGKGCVRFSDAWRASYRAVIFDEGIYWTPILGKAYVEVLEEDASGAFRAPTGVALSGMLDDGETRGRLIRASSDDDVTVGDSVYRHIQVQTGLAGQFSVVHGATPIGGFISYLIGTVDATATRVIDFSGKKALISSTSAEISIACADLKLSPTNFVRVSILDASALVGTNPTKDLVSVPYTALATADTVALRGTAGACAFGALTTGTVSSSGNVALVGQIVNTVRTIAYAANIEIDWDLGGVVEIGTLTGNVTFTFLNARPGATMKIQIKQDSTGSRTVTWPGSGPIGGAAGGVETAADRRTRLTLGVANDGTIYVDSKNWFAS